MQSLCYPTCQKHRTSENYERICLNKYIFSLNLPFGQVVEQIKAKTDMVCQMNI